jgi:Rhs element Vgr protein
MPNSPLLQDTNLVSFSILSNDTEIPSTYQVMAIRIAQHINRISEAEITLIDGDAASQEFSVTDSKVFVPGVKIEIKLGYQSNHTTVFRGIVVKQAIKIDEDGSRLQVLCKDTCLKLTTHRENTIFTNSTDSDAMGTLVDASGLSKDITATTVTHEKIVEYYTTDWDFIISRAESNGMIVITDNGTLVVAKPNVSATPELKVQYGYDILEFDVEVDATHQYLSTQGNAWDLTNQSVINASGSEPTLNNQGTISGKQLANVLGAEAQLNTSAAITQADIQTWADATLLKSRLSMFKGTVTFQGSAKAKVNSTIEINGVSDRLSGNAFISGVTHTLEDGRWITEVEIGLSPEWFVEKHTVSAPDASGLLPGIKGLQTGIVKKIESDPNNEFRVQVDIPMLGDGSDMVWARLSTFYNGNGIGAFFMPEIGNEVILGFMNDDPRFPIILGSVYSSSIPTPEVPDEKNTIKTIITQSKLQLKFDDENKVITLLTPGGNTIVISDEDKGVVIKDENGNSFEMNDKGVTINSASSLTLKASDDVTIEGTTVSISGSQSVSASGGSVSISGDQGTTVTGGAQCEVSSDGQMNVKGAMVMIN